MTLYLGSFINGLTHFLAKLRQTSRVSLFFMRKTFILALHQGKSVQNRGQSVILSGENHRLPYTITGGVFIDLLNIALWVSFIIQCTCVLNQQSSFLTPKLFRCSWKGGGGSNYKEKKTIAILVRCIRLYSELVLTFSKPV